MRRAPITNRVATAAADCQTRMGMYKRKKASDLPLRACYGLASCCQLAQPRQRPSQQVLSQTSERFYTVASPRTKRASAASQKKSQSPTNRFKPGRSDSPITVGNVQGGQGRECGWIAQADASTRNGVDAGCQP